MKNLKRFKKILIQRNGKFFEQQISMENPCIKLGCPIILMLDNGDIIKTSSVKDFYIDDYGRIKIMTNNTTYKN